MHKISKENINVLVQYLDNSPLPHADVKALCKMLLSLEVIEEVKTEAKEEK